jgi:hypothetical protein
LCTSYSYCSHVILPYVEWYTTFILNLSSVSASILYSIRKLSVLGIAVVCLHMHLHSDMSNPSERKATYAGTELCSHHTTV